MLIVIVVIGILATIVIVSYNGISKKAQISVISSDLHNGATQLNVFKTSTSTTDTFPNDITATNARASSGTTYQYNYSASDNTYCLSASRGTLSYYVTSASSVPVLGDCTSYIPAGYETAPLASGASTNFNGYNPVQPISCPTTGGSWVKVPGNTLYGTTYGFCVQKYSASNVSGVATSQPSGPRWTAQTQLVAKSSAEAVATGSHLLSEAEWMTMATNASAQPQNWSGGSVGNGTLSIGSATATYGGATITLSNGQVVNFDTGNTANYASYEWTCYTGSAANNCALAAQSEPIPGNAYYTDQFATFTSFGSLATNASGYYYGDPRYGNSSLVPYVTSARNNGLGYLYSTYAAGSSNLFTFVRGAFTGANSSGLYTLYIYTNQSYQHAQYGFRAAR